MELSVDRIFLKRKKKNFFFVSLALCQCLYFKPRVMKYRERKWENKQANRIISLRHTPVLSLALYFSPILRVCIVILFERCLFNDDIINTDDVELLHFILSKKPKKLSILLLSQTSSDTQWIYWVSFTYHHRTFLFSKLILFY